MLNTITSVQILIAAGGGERGARPRGYIRGGVSPVGTKKSYPFDLDETAILFGTISVSAGMRGCQMLLAPDDLTRVLDAQCCAISNGLKTSTRIFLIAPIEISFAGPVTKSMYTSPNV
jgi:hypothetical protein